MISTGAWEAGNAMEKDNGFISLGDGKPAGLGAPVETCRRGGGTAPPAPKGSRWGTITVEPCPEAGPTHVRICGLCIANITLPLSRLDELQGAIANLHCSPKYAEFFATTEPDGAGYRARSVDPETAARKAGA